MLGFEPWEFIDHPEFWKHHVHPEDLRPTMAQVPSLWKKGQHTFEYRFLHKDGTYRWIREEANVVRDADGKPIEVNGYWIDVTERKRLEEALAKSQRLATIGELAAMVGHDLRNLADPRAQSQVSIISENYAGLYPLGNLATPKNQLAQILTNRARDGQKTGKTSI